MWAKEIHWNSLALLRITFINNLLGSWQCTIKAEQSYKLIHVFQGQDGYKWRGGPDTQYDRSGIIAGWEDCVEYDHHKIKCKCSLCTYTIGDVITAPP